MSYRLLAALSLIALSTPALANPRYDYVQSKLLQSVPLSSDFTLGNKNAPVQLVEYASLTCPHCAHFHADVLPALKKYIDSDKMLYILRPYPLNEPALKAAMLVDCVGEKQGSERYYTFVRVLFDTQNKWAFDANWQASLSTISRVGGVNADMYEKCTTDNPREVKILNVKRDATKDLGVDHTPYVFINSHRYDGDVTADAMSAYIDKLLSSAPADKKQ